MFPGEALRSCRLTSGRERGAKMGVDFYPCKKCGETYCDCGDMLNYCEGCGEYICTNCLVKPAEYDEQTGEMKLECCPYCSGTVIHNDDLLEFLLKKYGITHAEAIVLYKEGNNG
jgi:hypothetical protein